ncbi:MAG TPA: single-stranded DNA-binding protein [Candidatus Dormibacteraeota bacterium]|nr:single-stranded DNA-binding protein [Candidatus Dormibacteraeota bacterium]
MVNKVILIGRLTADPEVRATASGTHVANLRIATNTYGGQQEDGSPREHTDFHSLVVFGRNAEIAGEYLRKGRLVYAEGRSQTRSWETAEGQRRYTTEIVVDSFKMLEPKSGDSPGAPAV